MVFDIKFNHDAKVIWESLGISEREAENIIKILDDACNIVSTEEYISLSEVIEYIINKSGLVGAKLVYAILELRNYTNFFIKREAQRRIVEQSMGSPEALMALLGAMANNDEEPQEQEQPSEKQPAYYA
jgi:hypothetical protein